MSFTAPRGRNYIRSLAAQFACKGNVEATNRFAMERWGAEGFAISKAAVSAISAGNFGTQESIEYFNAVREKSVLGGLVGMRPVPVNKRVTRRTNGPVGFWVAEGAPIPLLKPVLAGSTLGAKKVAAICK